MLRLLRNSIFLFLIFVTPVFASVGEITAHKGNGEIRRDKSSFESKKGLSVNMMDKIYTANGTSNITFNDKTNLTVTAQSEIIIDDFVYSGNQPASSRMSMAVLRGTATFTTGLIGKANAKNVRVRTPTASIGIRGTNFSMTVDELGGSIIVLLPNADGSVGAIDVTTDAGTVFLNQAFQATKTMSLETKPANPVILKIDESQISNILIVSTPEALVEAVENDPLGFSGLNRDLLAFKFLDFNALDINELNVDLLYNPLDTKYLFDHEDGKTSGFNPTTQVNTIKSETHTQIIRMVENTIDVKNSNDSPLRIEMNTSGSYIVVETGDSPMSTLRIQQD